MNRKFRLKIKPPPPLPPGVYVKDLKNPKKGFKQLETRGNIYNVLTSLADTYVKDPPPGIIAYRKENVTHIINDREHVMIVE